MDLWTSQGTTVLAGSYSLSLFRTRLDLHGDRKIPSLNLVSAPLLRFELSLKIRYKPNRKENKSFCFCVNVAYVSGMCPRGEWAEPSSRYFSSRDGSVELPCCRWISGFVCSRTHPLPRPRLSSWFLRLKMFILLSSSGLAFSEPVGLGSLRLTGSTGRPFWARQESSDSEESSSCTTTLGSLQGSRPEKEGGQQWWEL